jgi:hypothetical protein
MSLYVNSTNENFSGLAKYTRIEFRYDITEKLTPPLLTPVSIGKKDK